MPKIDVNALPMPLTVRESKTFADALVPGKSLEITFEVEPDYAVILQAQALGARYTKERSGPSSVPISVAGKTMRPTPEICSQIAIIQTLERPDDPQDRYSFEEWVKLSRLMPNAFADVAEHSDKLIRRAFSGINEDDAPIPNDYAVLGPLTSEPPSNTAATDTPMSSPGSPRPPKPPRTP